uniref:Uncharacterized protein n=1 Tax=Chenopodium quinoa TaxID=63459 RepID=A0A803LR46_CHEQI
MSKIPGHESSLNPDPSNDLRGMMRTILDRQDTMEQTIQSLLRQSASAPPPHHDSEVASPLHLDDGNGDREAPTKIEEDILRLKEVLKGMTKAEPWLDIHGLTLFPKARLPLGFKMPNLTIFDDDEEDALLLLSMAEKNVGAHLSTPSNFQCPIYLDDLSDDEDLHVAHLTRAGRHFKPSYLKDENPVEALRRKEKDRELVQVNKEEDDAIKRMKEVNANVSIWKLLTNSQPHRAAILRLLNEVSIDASITPDQMERRPKVHPQGERANRKIFTRIEEPLSVVYDRLREKGILWAKSYVYSLPPHGTDMRQYCSYCHLYGHRTDTCYDLKCAIQDLIDHGIITPAHPKFSVPETSPAQPRPSS